MTIKRIPPLTLAAMGYIQRPLFSKLTRAELAKQKRFLRGVRRLREAHRGGWGDCVHD